MDGPLTPLRSSPRAAFLAVLLVPLVSLAATLTLAAATTPSPDEVTCGGGILGNRLKAQFEVPQARAIADRFPGGPELPELENDRPARVLVFDDPFTFFRDGKQYTGVVCVIQDATPILYYDLPVDDRFLLAP